MRGLAAAGIASGRYFAPIHLQPSYAAWRHSANLPVTEAEASRTLALPFFNNIEADAIDYGLRYAGPPAVTASSSLSWFATLLNRIESAICNPYAMFYSRGWISLQR